MIEGLGRTCADDFSEHSVAMEKCGRYLNANFISIIGGKVTHHLLQSEGLRAFQIPKEAAVAPVIALPARPELPSIQHEIELSTAI